MPKFTIADFEQRALEALERRRQRRKQPQPQLGLPDLAALRVAIPKIPRIKLPNLPRKGL